MKTKGTLMLLLICLATGVIAQEAKKFRIKINTVENGKETNIDTSFSSREDMEAFMADNGFRTEMPELPELPALPELPRIPDLPELPDMEKIIIELDDTILSDQEKAELKKEMEAAKQEMLKAKKEMKINHVEWEKSRKEMEKSREELERNKEEMKKINKEVRMIRIDVNDNEVAQKEFNFVMNNDELISGDENYKVILHNCDEGAIGYKFMIDGTSGENAGKKCIVAVYCDSTMEGNDKVKVIRKIKVTGEPAEEMKMRSPLNTTEPEITEVVSVPTNAPKRTTDSHELAANDFRLYPNPTEGKITVSFRTEQEGPIEVKLLDTSGRVLVDETVEAPGGFFNKDYSIESGARGTYLLQLRQGEQWRHEKIVVK